jgi:hypothetical protein
MKQWRFTKPSSLKERRIKMEQKLKDTVQLPSEYSVIEQDDLFVVYISSINGKEVKPEDDAYLDKMIRNFIRSNRHLWIIATVKRSPYRNEKGNFAYVFCKIAGGYEKPILDDTTIDINGRTYYIRDGHENIKGMELMDKLTNIRYWYWKETKEMHPLIP